MPTDAATVDALAIFAFTMHARLETAAARAGLSVTQVRLLGILRDREPTSGELAALLELRKSSVTGLIDRAADRGLVSRIPDPDDARAVRVRLEPAGREIIDEAAARFAEELSGLLAAVAPDDRRTWTRVTEHLIDAGRQHPAS